MKSNYLMSVICLLSIGVVWSNEPTILIDRVDGDKGAVVFSHEKHQKEIKVEGKTLSCRECHHGDKDDEVQNCVECHLPTGQPKAMNDVIVPTLFQKNTDGKVTTSDVLYHKTCKNCHIKIKNNSKGESITGCAVCHKKKQ